MNMETNEFARISKLVDTIVTRYREVRKICGIPDDGWHSRTIERIAKPFINGYFTLAVVGKVSSGKSTFINALLGCKELLPTGHDQTTCGITYIEYGEKPEVTIIFGDGSKKVIKDDISGKIKAHVAIPEKYHHLPINNIDDMIMGGLDFYKIWEVHNQLEEETLCPPINKSLLKEYVTNRKKKDIAVEVRMKYPFNEELKGWRVIDTPGIGAIGGIETRTKQLLASQKEDGTREVDAIIFLQNGSETLDQTDTKKFVKEQLDNLTESDKDRLFYILTHSSSPNFITHKESKIDFITQNYGNKIKVLTYADSLLHTFLNDLKGSDVSLDEFIKFAKPNEWADDEWKSIMGVLFQATLHLQQTYNSVNHDTMLRTIQEWAHFDELKKEINTFAKNEKQKSLSKLLNLIATDYLGFVKQLDKEKELVDGDLAAIKKEREKVKEKRDGYNRHAQNAANLFSMNRIESEFSFINKELQAMDKLNSIAFIRTSITHLFDAVQKKERKVFNDLKNQFSSFLKSSDSVDIILESIDFEAIEKQAVSKSEEVYEIEPEKVKEHITKADERIPAKYDTRINQEKKLREFKALVIKRVKNRRDNFMKQVNQKIKDMSDQIFDELYEKLKKESKRCDELESQLNRKEEFKSENDAFIKKSHEAANELIKLAQDYGYKF